MKVLHVVATTERRGAEMFASQLVEALAGDGISQHVAIIRGEGDPVLRFQGAHDTGRGEQATDPRAAHGCR